MSQRYTLTLIYSAGHVQVIHIDGQQRAQDAFEFACTPRVQNAVVLAVLEQH